MSVVIVVECMKLHLLYSEELQQVTSLYLKVVFYITSIWFVWAAGFINHGDVVSINVNNSLIVNVTGGFYFISVYRAVITGICLGYCYLAGIVMPESTGTCAVIVSSCAVWVHKRVPIWMGTKAFCRCCIDANYKHQRRKHKAT